MIAGLGSSGRSGAAAPADAVGAPRLGGPSEAALATGRKRIQFAGAVFVLAFALVAGRTIDVTVFRPLEQRPAPSAPAKPAPAKPGPNIAGIGPAPPAAEPRAAPAAADQPPAAAVPRGDILDRGGRQLATSIVSWSLYIDPKSVVQPERLVRELPRMFPDLDAAEIREKLKSDKRFVWLKRHIRPDAHQALIDRGLVGRDASKTGLGVVKEYRRVYPQGAALAHVTGFVDIDSTGRAGIEQRFERALAKGETVRLAIDLAVQTALRDELAAQVKRFDAVGAAGLILDIKTGEVLAMVSLPDFDPNRAGSAPEDARFNRVTLGLYEMGSTFKIFNSAMALDAGTATLDKRYDARAPLVHGKHTIRDYHGLGRWLTVAETFQFSSNIASARMALEAGTARQRAFMERIGFLKPVALELPELGQPLYPRDWKTINTITIAYGHGLSVSPLHLVVGVAAIANDGKAAPTTLLRRDPGAEPAGTKVVSPKTAAEMRQLMRLVVEKGTGKRAEAAGYLVGGKTGTADKPSKRGYLKNARLSSFVGVFPTDRPRFAILVMIDEPKGKPETGGEATGGIVAAPVVREVVLRVAPLLKLVPADPPAPAAAAPRLERVGARPPLPPAAR
jgi:cell division protein FtsI (penicillin-binding protein 3)